MVLFLWMEWRRKTISLRPSVETYVIGPLAAFGTSHWLVYYALWRDDDITDGRYFRLALFSFSGALAVVVAAYLAVAMIRKYKRGGENG